jgi:two-component sensor histidine kinase
METSQKGDIKLNCDCPPLMLDLDTATALGLVIAELISNSYRHAFPKESGTIRVSLKADDEGDGASIQYSDDGVGFKEAGPSKRRGPGLVRRLMEQVEGSAELVNDHGAIWTLRFRRQALAISGV